MKRLLIPIFICCFLSTTVIAQFGIGLTLSHDLYNRYVNPKDGIESASNGSLLLNLALGPKIWIGGESFSFSAEAQANWGVLGLSIADYKGLGSTSFPFIGKFNFGGLSGLNKEGRFGYSIGGGVQYNKTEIYYLNNDFEERGGERKFFKTYVIQAGYGFGVSGFAMQGFIRYGFNPDIDGASNIHIGLQYDFNIPKLKKIADPASAL